MHREGENVRTALSKKRYLILALAVLMIGILFIPSRVFAAEEIDYTKTGTISITLKDTETSEPIPGGELSLYQVAEIVDSDSGATLVYTDDFSSALGSSAPSISESTDLTAELAAQFATVVTENNIAPFDSGTVGEDGTVTFSDLPLGLYLVVETESAEGYDTLSPYLLMVPTLGEDGTYHYTMDTYPKMEKTTTVTPTVTPVVPHTPGDNPKNPSNPGTSTKTSTPHTGGSTTRNYLPQTGQLWWPVPLLLVGGAALVAGGLRSRRRQKRAAEASES
ncbi:MAG: SpaA isopeptide-forming pilin-related protein [Bilifractor sp.]|jgi:hypothetical protein